LIELTPRARRQLDDLRAYYEDRQRPEALWNLADAVERAAERIERDPAAGFPAPRPYPSLAQPGRAWIKEGSYWFAYSIATPPVIVGIFHDTADIPGRA
jgi:plasmid stabilization system protein ParE